jgi:hypothetical protein
MIEDRSVTDLNAVQFALEQLLPLALDWGAQLDAATRDALQDALRAAAGELVRLDVHVSYTNIVLLDTLNLALLARVLDDAMLAARAATRFAAWVAYTCRSGGVTEYNSPTYAAVDLAALAELAERAADARLRIRARVMEERLWLHVAVRWHAATAQLAGPHGRAYHNDVTGGVCGIKLVLYAVLGDPRLLWRSAYATARQTPGSVAAGRRSWHLPAPLRHLFAPRTSAWQVHETVDQEHGVDLTTMLTPSYALGSASSGSHAQSDRLMLTYAVAAPRAVGILFSRYIVNDKTFGSYYHATDRSLATMINDEGQSWIAQDGGRAIVLYGLLPQREPVFSLKTEVTLIDGALADAVVIDGVPAALPAALRPWQQICVADGAVYIGLIPLAATNLGGTAPILLHHRGDELVLSIANYHDGEAHVFWEYATLAGPFYQRNIRAGFIIEVAERRAFADLAAFASHLQRSRIDDRDHGARRRVCYSSGAHHLELTVDLHANRLIERRRDGRLVEPPLLACPGAVQRRGPMQCGAAWLDAGDVAAWLVGDDAAAHWLAGVPALDATPVTLQTPVATIRCAAFGFGRIAITGGATPQIDIIADAHHAPLVIDAAVAPAIRWNGHDIRARCIADATPGRLIIPHDATE